MKTPLAIVCRRQKHTGKVIAIRREDQSVWERRAPLAPSNVYQLKKRGVKVIIQPSNRRAYPVQSYINAGAVIQEDISEASVIFGVKQVPVDLLLPDKTYCMFSHTIKAQESNMPLLDAILAKNIRLIDYEKLVDENGNRVVAFGKYAGVAGMLNILHGIGLRLLALGHHTPFMHLGPAHNYRNSMMARQAIRDTGYEIALGMMPKSIGPITFAFTGSGNVSQGAQEIFQELPHEYVPPAMLQKVAEHGSRTKLYGCVVGRHHYLERIEGGGYDQEEYEQSPQLYKSTFHKKIAPYCSVIINGIYWAVGAPKLLTVPDAKALLRPINMPWLPTSEGAPRLPHRILAICDISADPGGSIEFMSECTTIDNPFSLYDAEKHQDTNSFKGAGILICSIDNMPTQLPTESTDFFGNLMMPYALDIIKSDATEPLRESDFKPSVYGAIIASNGQLTPNFQYIQELRNVNSRSRGKGVSTPDAAMKNVLVLGSGYVCGPLIEYLNKDPTIQITLASSIESDLRNVANKYDGVTAEVIDVLEPNNSLKNLVKNADVVVSLLPYRLHPKVAEMCIECGVNMVTASYCTDDMMKLHDKAVEAGITVVNEVGLDPGIDHLLAMECVDGIHEAGGKIESFVSYCGGLPAPEYSDNPLRYKFSWNPRSVLLNPLGCAKYLSDSKIEEIPNGELLKYSKKLNFLPGFALEGMPNRDSVKYAELYGIAAEAQTVFRGTLRYHGFLDTWKALNELGLIDENPHPALHPQGPEITWRWFICTLLGLPTSDIFYENLKDKVGEKVGKTNVANIEQLNLLQDTPVEKLSTPLDTLSHYLNQHLSFSPEERDVVILHHDIVVSWPVGRKESKTITLVEYGQPNGNTAMARTVGLPAAIATNMVLQGEIQNKGMILPLSPDIYRTILNRLRDEGLKFIERNTSI